MTAALTNGKKTQKRGSAKAKLKQRVVPSKPELYPNLSFGHVWIEQNRLEAEIYGLNRIIEAGPSAGPPLRGTYRVELYFDSSEEIEEWIDLLSEHLDYIRSEEEQEELQEEERRKEHDEVT